MLHIDVLFVQQLPDPIRDEQCKFMKTCWWRHCNQCRSESKEDSGWIVVKGLWCRCNQSQDPGCEGRCVKLCMRIFPYIRVPYQFLTIASARCASDYTNGLIVNTRFRIPALRTIRRGVVRQSWWAAADRRGRTRTGSPRRAPGSDPTGMRYECGSIEVNTSSSSAWWGKDLLPAFWSLVMSTLLL